jgi:hypothetical protein
MVGVTIHITSQSHILKCYTTTDTSSTLTLARALTHLFRKLGRHTQNARPCHRYVCPFRSREQILTALPFQAIFISRIGRMIYRSASRSCWCRERSNRLFALGISVIRRRMTTCGRLREMCTSSREIGMRCGELLRRNLLRAKLTLDLYPEPTLPKLAALTSPAAADRRVAWTPNRALWGHRATFRAGASDGRRHSHHRSHTPL